ncbi:MAG TPA: MFS transporter [Candidatus Saccharimonadales bacterium]|nr:MFS transporter [Candidatus Saccharimonadales bacterium]
MTAVSVQHSTAGAAFRYPNFRLFQAARFLVVAGLEMQSVAVGWQIYEITRRPLDLGLAGLAQFLPGLLLFLLGGHVADRFDRRSVLLACYASFAVCALALLAITLRGLHGVAPVYMVLVAMGFVRVFNGPAGQAFAPLLVPADVFPNAAAWGSSIFNAATILGPVVGGVLYALRGNPIAVYSTAAAALGASVVLMLAIRIRGVQQMSQGRDWKAVLAGFQYVLQNKLILGTTTLDLFAVLLGGAVALLPVFAREVLNSGPRGLGLLRASPGIGAGLMAIMIAYHPLKRRAGTKMLCCVAAFGVATILFGVSRNLHLSMFALLIVGSSDMVSVIVRSTVVQLATPDEMRGRVSAVNMLFIGASNEFGQFESGITAQWMGAVPAVVAGGIGTIIVVAVWSWLFPALRKVDHLTPESLAIAAEQNLTEPQ